MVRIKRIVAIIVAALLAIGEIVFVALLFANEARRYLYPDLYFGKISVMVISILSIVGIFLIIFLIYRIIREFSLIKTVAILLLLVVVYFGNISITLLPSNVVQSGTNDVRNYLCFDNRAERIIVNEVGNELLCFDKDAVTSYEYSYKEGLFLYQSVELNITATLSEADYQKYTDSLSVNPRINSESAGEDKVALYTLVMKAEDNMVDYSKSCEIRCCDDKREVTVSIYIEYIR